MTRKTVPENTKTTPSISSAVDVNTKIIKPDEEKRKKKKEDTDSEKMIQFVGFESISNFV